MELNSTLIAQKYSDTRDATAPDPSKSGQTLLGRAAEDFAQVLQRSENTAMNSMISNADPHALVQSLVQTELAVETVVTVRNKVVEAYQEILRMPV